MSLPSSMPTIQNPNEIRDNERLEAPANLLRAMTDLYVVRKHHTFEETRQYEEIALRMLPDMEPETCRAVARVLAPNPEAPASVLEALMQRDDECAAIVLSIAPALSDDALVAAAQFGPADQAVAVAFRAGVSTDLVSILMTREESMVWRALAENASALLDREALAELARRGRNDAKIARAICARTDDPIALQGLFLHASPTQRSGIVLEAERQELLAPSQSRSADPVMAGQLEMLAMQQETDGFRARLAEALSCDAEIARLIAIDQSGEPLAVALVSIGLSPEAIARLLNPATGSNRFTGLLRRSRPARRTASCAPCWGYRSRLRRGPSDAISRNWIRPPPPLRAALLLCQRRRNDVRRRCSCSAAACADHSLNSARTLARSISAGGMFAES